MRASLKNKVKVQTLRTSVSCRTMVHSRAHSSYFRRPRSLSAHNASTALRYSSATHNISYVEFQRVRTSRGINFSGSFKSTSSFLYAGRRMVLEWTTLAANWRSYGCALFSVCVRRLSQQQADLPWSKPCIQAESSPRIPPSPCPTSP